MRMDVDCPIEVVSVLILWDQKRAIDHPLGQKCIYFNYC